MRSAPDDLREADVRLGLAAWNLEPTELTYVPVGGGSHHWACRASDGARYFLTVDDLRAKPWLGTDPGTVFDGLTAALGTALDLQSAGLEFVLAPIPAPERQVARRLSKRYTLSVYPFLDGRAGEFPEQLPPEDGVRLAGMLARLHRARPHARVPVRPLDLAERQTLEAALADLARPWHTGPFGELARQWLSTNAARLQQALESFDHLKRQVLDQGLQLVITHGEPHPANLIRQAARIFLIDWDTLGLAPSERDLWFLENRCPGSLAAYVQAGGIPPDPGALELYQRLWAFEDVAAFTTLFRSAHRRTADTERWAAMAERFDVEQLGV
jgi:spectinomycin phosphotransferase